MREHARTTDIVIRFPVSSRQLPDVDREIFFADCALSRVFDDVISKAPVKKKKEEEKKEKKKKKKTTKNTIRAKLSAEVYLAYKATWLLLFQSMYVGGLDPRTNVAKKGDAPKLDRPKWFEKMEQVLKSKRSAGAPKKDNDDQLRTRLNLLVDHCENLRGKIIEHQVEEGIVKVGLRRVDVLRNFWRRILKVPGGVSILGGEAFLKIGYAKQDSPPKLEDPTTWKARQLAIALLAFEQGQEYHTIERKFPLRKKIKRLPTCK